ncbi:MAG: hypothetical protein D6796_03770 [Caldilineae bacterium]|nr:MAG: hypothetical protein D6796_03770 [Caldilineae bacterium]
MTEREQIEQAIAALEAQRAILGDAAVDTSIAALREKLAALTPSLPANQQRKQVTVLFADVSGFTAMSETMDAEEVSDLMNALWQDIDSIVVKHGGVIDKHIGDAVMALWSVENTREDDPERAIRAALEMQARLARLQSARRVRLAMRIGINTGLVVLGGVGTTGEFSAMGDAVNLASRLEHAAPVGGVLISHDTYRHVRGIFDVSPQEPLRVKGKAEPLQTYVVLRAKPRAFHIATRGVEGIETRMVGRDAELLILQDTFHDAIEESETRLVTIVGEAGVGKSRLLNEFENWIDLLPDPVYYFKGRATPEMQTIPYSIIRDMFAYRFDILESDNATTVLEKFRAGMKGILDADQSDLVGHLVGFDFSASQGVQNLLGSPSFGKLAIAYLTNYMRAITEEPTVIFLEDIHWADDSSLDLLDRLVDAIPTGRLLLVCLARPRFFERRPDWGQNGHNHTRLDLKPLSRRASRMLVDGILQKVEDIPDELRNLIVEGAEGNPFYVEELIKMLIEDGIILCGEEKWSVEPGRLTTVRVPPTLTGVLQARLDSLPHKEKILLQRASVVGRLFWDAAVVELGAGDADRFRRDEITPLLEAVCKRELVFRQERSTFEGANEYLFKHAILRDVTYETVLLKLRRVYHTQVAKWLESNAGERAGEFLSLIAQHYELAGEKTKAVAYLKRSGEALYKINAYRDAMDAFNRALAMLPESKMADRAALRVNLGNACRWMSDFPAAVRNFEEGLALAVQVGDLQLEAESLCGLGVVANMQGYFDKAIDYLEKGLELARKTNNPLSIANALMKLAWASQQGGHLPEAEKYAEEGLSIFRKLGNRQGIADCLNTLGVIARLRQDGERAKRYYEESLALCREIGDRRGASARLHNFGELLRAQGKYEEAIPYYQKSLEICREIGDRMIVANALTGLGTVYLELGKYDAGRKYLRESLKESWAIGSFPLMLETLVGLAMLRVKTGSPLQGAEYLGLVLAHPAFIEEIRLQTETVLAALRRLLPPEKIEEGLERGKTLDLETIVAGILQD